MEYIPSFRDDLRIDIQPSFTHSFRDEHNAKMMYGLPKVKKFPMPDAKHVRSAIRFFNYAKPSQERELANAILARMDDYGIDPDDINIGDDNRFKKYLQHSYLAHHGIKGMHCGVRRYENYDGTLTPAGKKRYAVRESKGGLLGFKRTFMDADLKKADEIGGSANRDAVYNRAVKAVKNDPEVKAAETECKKSVREAYSIYANIYNKKAAEQGISQRVNPKTFNWYTQLDELDSDVDSAVWDSKGPDIDKLYAAQNRHRANVSKLERAHTNAATRFVKPYQDAVLADIPNDGSKQAVKRILERYGNLDTFDFTESLNENSPDYGWGSNELFDA